MGMISKNLTVEQAVEAHNLKSSNADQVTPQQVTILKKMGFTNGEQVEYFNAEIKANPNLEKVFKKLEGDFAANNKYDGLLKKIGSQVLKDGAKIDFDTDTAANKGTGVLDKLSKDLSDKSISDKLVNKIKTNPDSVAANLDKYNAGNTTLIAIVADNQSTTRQMASKVENSPPQARNNRGKVVVETEVTKPRQSLTNENRAEEVMKQIKEAPISTTNAIDQIAETLAKASDADIRAKLSSSDVKIFTNGFAEQALKLGVPKEFTDSFKQRMANDKKLREAFEENLKNNPELVRQMAKSMKEDGKMPDAMKEMAKKTMMDIMENPEQLADNAFAKRMTQGLQAKNAGGMNMNNMLGGLGGIFSGLGDMGGMFAGIGEFFQKVMGFFKEVQGGEWMSRGNSGRNFLQRFSDVISDTPARLASEKDAVQKMVIHPAIDKNGVHYTHLSPVLGKDGKPIMGDDGKPLTKLENNTIEIETISGTKMKVLPATGALAVRDKQNNYHMMMVTDAKVGANGIRTPESVTQVVISPEEYVKYNEQMKKYGDPSMPPPQYAMADNNVKNILNTAAPKDGPTIIHLDANGQPVELRTIRRNDDLEVRPLAAANDPNLKIQA